jgi:hypothetical protein
VVGEPGARARGETQGGNGARRGWLKEEGKERKGRKKGKEKGKGKRKEEKEGKGEKGKKKIKWE